MAKKRLSFFPSLYESHIKLMSRVSSRCFLSNEDLAEMSIEEATKQGATYADVRFFKTEEEQMTVKDRNPERVEFGYGTDFGLRVIMNGAWGFAGSNHVSSRDVRDAVSRAVKIAKASALTKKDDVKLCDVQSLEANYKTEILEDPLKVPTEDILDILIETNKTMKEQGTAIKMTYSLFRGMKQEKYFANSEGSRISQTIVWSGGGMYCVASRNSEVQKRSYPAFDGCFNTGGFEVFMEMDMINNARRVGKEALSLLDAVPCPKGEKTLLLGPEQVWLQIHESCGHPTELDRALGSEVDSAGTSFLRTDMLNKFRYGSDEVNLVADSTTKRGLGTFGYDDEGVPSKKIYLIKEGMFVGYQSSRETAQKIGLEECSSSMRCMHGNDLPIVRMSNINLLPGDWTRDEIIDDTKDGVLMDTTRSWSIDQERLNFQFGTEIGYIVRKGELSEMIKNPTYTGITYEFWRNCDASGKDDWKIFGTPGCGKGNPSQSMYVGHGCGTSRFSKIRVGIV
jgi:TldD protein